MVGSIVTLAIKLEAATRQEGDLWLAWCLPLDVWTQAETKQAALKSLKEAVGLWFESCIARNVLDEALIESGFKKLKAGESAPDNASSVKVHEPIRRHARKRDYIEGSIPAYIAAQCSADNLCARR